MENFYKRCSIWNSYVINKIGIESFKKEKDKTNNWKHID